MTVDTYRKGDHWIIDDRTGERVRASDARTEWNGNVVSKDDYEERHPQELVRPVRDDQRPRGPVRPQETPIIVGPLVAALAADAAAGATALQLDSAVRFKANDFIRIALDNADTFRTQVLTVVDATNITVSPGLASKASSGNAVVNETAIATVDIG